MTQPFFICGTGRNGSLSIAQFLSAQPDMRCLHEGGDAASFSRHRLKQALHLAPVFKWEGEWDRYRDYYTQQRARRPEHYLGDVGMYMLGYVPQLARAFPNARFLSIRRSKDQVVRSYLHRSLDLRADATRYDLVRKIWDACYPRYRVKTMKEALELYWDDYYARSEALERELDGRFKIFETQNLNSATGRHQILDFIGYPKTGRVDFTVHTNKESPLFTRWNELIKFIRE
ncbi:MAG: sulfotransferase [Sandaracinaceae bacterium]|nr:sulfotransferase [Sandaracinaceae bacterium]